jgi:hypothetical protein
MTRTSWILSVGVLCALAQPALAQGRGRYGVPPGHLPPPGTCRVWIAGVPPGHQPRPTSCAAARWDRRQDGRIIYGSAYPMRQRDDYYSVRQRLEIDRQRREIDRQHRLWELRNAREIRSQQAWEQRERTERALERARRDDRRRDFRDDARRDQRSERGLDRLERRAWDDWSIRRQSTARPHLAVERSR